MSSRRLPIWLVSGLVAALSLASLFMFGLVLHDSPLSAIVPTVLSQTLFRLFPMTFTVLGLVVLRRWPRHSIGWVSLALAAALTTRALAESYAEYGLVESHPLPGAVFGHVVSQCLWTAPLGCVLLWLLLLPDGRVLSPRWRWIVWASVIVPVLIAVRTSLESSAVVSTALTPSEPGAMAPDPSAFENSAGVSLIRAVWPLSVVTIVVPLQALLVPSILCVLLRFRRARGAERQQLKWIAFACTIPAVTYPVAFTQVFDGWGDLLNNLGFLAIPVGVGIAVLRYRLYDIDVIIRRTLVYGVLSVALGLIYWVAVVASQQVPRPLTQGSDLAIVTSTLAVAALFQPLRTRIQNGVDRHFYRQRYNATRILESFSARLRDEIDLEALGSELLQVTRQTMQPQRASSHESPRR